MLAKRVIRPALRNPKNYRDLEAKPLEWRGFYSLRRGIATQLTVMTRDSMVAEGLLRAFRPQTTLLYYIKDVPEVTANGMARIEQLFSKLDEKAIQRKKCDKTGRKGRAITRLNRKGILSNSKARRRLVAEEEGFEPPRPFRV